MLAILSPAKTLDLAKQTRSKKHGVPEFIEDSGVLVKKLRTLSRRSIIDLMGVSDNLARDVQGMYAAWQSPFTPANAKQALFTFRGDVYTGLDADSFSTRDVAFAQDHLRILSGLYGVLRPVDLMQPYRLEMGTRLATRRGKTLYAFWGIRIHQAIVAALEAQGDDALVNLASNEYFKSVQPVQLKAEVITPSFREEQNGNYKMITFFAKQARGSMAAFLIKNRLKKIDDLKAFNLEGYRFRDRLSIGNQWVFTRKAKS